jgi:hypothetical protein
MSSISLCFSPDGLRRSAFNSTPSDLARPGANNTFKVPKNATKNQKKRVENLP